MGDALNQATEVLTCKNRIARDGDGGFHHDMKRECGQVLSAVRLPVVPTGNVLSDVRHLGPHCIAAWCPRCKKATEYRYLTMLDDVA